MDDINAKATVNAEFEAVWQRATPGNKPGRPVAKYWFRNGRDCGLAARAAEERAVVKELRERLAELEKADAAKLAREVQRLSESLAELHYCARQLRHSILSRVELKKERVRVDAAINTAGKLVAGYSAKVRVDATID